MMWMRNRTWWKTLSTTQILILFNVAYFLLLEREGSTSSTKLMLKYGAMYAPYILEKGEYYRLLTAMFMHFGIQHLISNMLILYLVGDTLDRALGRFKYVLLYLASGIGGNFVSLVWDVDSVSVGAGASGAVFGVIGALLWAAIANKGKLEDLDAVRIILMLGFSIYAGLGNPGIDNVAHISGALIGFIFSFLLYEKRGWTS